MIRRLMVSATTLIALGSLTGAAIACTLPMMLAEKPDDRSADAAAIRAHIESIFQAFIDGDIDKIYATHSADWRGFLEGSQTPIKGIDDYMQANGIEWPRPAGAPKMTPYYPKGTGYQVSDFDVAFYSPDLAVASFFGEFVRKENDTTVVLNRFRIMDVYAKRKGNWIQVSSHTVVDPVWRQEQMSKPLAINPRLRQRLLGVRESVWRAYFSNDKAALERLIPADVVAIDGGSEGFSNRADILSGAQRFAESGSKLVKLEFPKTEIQVYGNTIIMYTTYSLELESAGKRVTQSGRGTEMFVRRGDDIVNVGWHLDDKKQ